MGSLEGVWISRSSENYDEYLTELGKLIILKHTKVK